jgi:pimeloyl-ACP methyl ester carboxylesterase
MGGRIAIELAATRPELAPRLVLLGASLGLEDDTERARRAAEDDARTEEILRDGLDAFVERWYRLPIFAPFTRHASFSATRLRRPPRPNCPLHSSCPLRPRCQPRPRCPLLPNCPLHPRCPLLPHCPRCLPRPRCPLHPNCPLHPRFPPRPRCLFRRFPLLPRPSLLQFQSLGPTTAPRQSRQHRARHSRRRLLAIARLRSLRLRTIAPRLLRRRRDSILPLHSSLSLSLSPSPSQNPSDLNN